MILKSRAETPAPRQPVAVPAGTVVYAVGDIHGRLDLLTELRRRIVADAGRLAATRRVIVYLGDYVDRGPDSRGVIDLVLNPLDGFTAIALRGNHERIMLDFLDDAKVGPLWLHNGGGATMDSYGVAVTSEDENDPEVLADLQADLREKLPQRHRDFLVTLKSMHSEGDYLFVHAGIRPGVPLDQQREEDILWIRNPFLNSADDHGHVVVHGHTIASQPQFASNRIGIDTGAYYSGRLTCLALEGAGRRIIQAEL
jgi:serine/threonine protein phosphatase 1